MKNKFSGFLRKYWLCFLLSIIIVLGVSVTSACADLYHTGGDTLSFDLGDLYLLFGIPTFSFAYGCLTYAILKKVCIPHLILVLVSFAFWFRFDIDALFWAGTFIWTAVPLVFSLIGTAITAFICLAARKIREDMKE